MSGSPGRKPSLSSPKSKSRAAKKHKFEDVLARATDDGSDAGHDGGGGDDDDEMYVDYSKAEEGDLPKLGSSTFKDQSVSREHSFPFQLHFMLSETEADGLSSVVSWQTHGRCFRVHDQQRFTKELLPLCFRQTRYQSFQRQLNIYGFKRLKTGIDSGSYYHPLFLRGKPFLCKFIQRKEIKGNTAKGKKAKVAAAASPHQAEEPCFYRMPYLPQHPSLQSKKEMEAGSSESKQNSSPKQLLQQQGQPFSLHSFTAATAAAGNSNSLSVSNSASRSKIFDELERQRQRPHLLLVGERGRTVAIGDDDERCDPIQTPNELLLSSLRRPHDYDHHHQLSSPSSTLRGVASFAAGRGGAVLPPNVSGAANLAAEPALSTPLIMSPDRLRFQVAQQNRRAALLQGLLTSSPVPQGQHPSQLQHVAASMSLSRYSPSTAAAAAAAAASDAAGGVLSPMLGSSELQRLQEQQQRHLAAAGGALAHMTGSSDLLLLQDQRQRLQNAAAGGAAGGILGHMTGSIDLQLLQEQQQQRLQDAAAAVGATDGLFGRMTGSSDPQLLQEQQQRRLQDHLLLQWQRQQQLRQLQQQRQLSADGLYSQGSSQVGRVAPSSLGSILSQHHLQNRFQQRQQLVESKETEVAAAAAQQEAEAQRSGSSPANSALLALWLNKSKSPGSK